MKFKLGKIDFEVAAVSNEMRAAVLGDPIIQQVVWRDVYRWDHAAGAGEVLVQVAKSGAVPLPNGLVFFVPTPGDGPITKSEGASRTMSKRVLEGVGAKSVTDLLRALHNILHMPQKILPLEVFEPLNGAASYMLKMHTEFNVVELRNASRNMSFHLIIPGQVAFHHELTAKDDAAYDKVISELPEVANVQAEFLIPAHSKANEAIRTLALSRRIKEMQDALKIRAAAGEKLEGDAVPRAYTMAVGEWRLLTKARKAA